MRVCKPVGIGSVTALLLAGCTSTQIGNLRAGCPSMPKGSSINIAIKSNHYASTNESAPTVYKLDATRSLKIYPERFCFYENERCVRTLKLSSFIAEAMSSCAVRIDRSSNRYVIVQQQGDCGSGAAQYDVIKVGPNFPTYAVLHSSSGLSLVDGPDKIVRFQSNEQLGHKSIPDGSTYFYKIRKTGLKLDREWTLHCSGGFTDAPHSIPAP